ncbi:hypothetical protein [Streptococcus suis]|uniref:hypothetical protein n=1 Tax=Streptococcus suis TaxID=1307 RepID=UPI002A8A27F2|nr:hypothetical protein [Streptococcus suis]
MLKIPKDTIISGFAGIGKTTASSRFSNVLDLESSFYFFSLDKGISNTEVERLKGSKSRVLNPNGLDDYIQAILQNKDKYDYVLIAMFPSLLSTLAERGIDVQVVLPHQSDKLEYVRRYETRGNSSDWVSSMESRWDEYLEFNQSHNPFASTPIVLHKGEYLSNIIYGEF